MSEFWELKYLFAGDVVPTVAEREGSGTGHISNLSITTGIVALPWNSKRSVRNSRVS